MNISEIRGIIFDMDNTLLQSNIDFAGLKQDMYDFLNGMKLLPAALRLEEHTTSMLMEEAKRRGADSDVQQKMMEIAEKYETAGMEEAGLEPGALELLEHLHNRYVLAVITNNAQAAADKALGLTGAAAYFDLVVGREKMTALKPSPSGFEYVLNRYPAFPPASWLSLGDSWIDGAAASAAGVSFIAYKTKAHLMEHRNVQPQAYISDLKELLDLLQSKLPERGI